MEDDALDRMDAFCSSTLCVLIPAAYSLEVSSLKELLLPDLL
jgi:hypothetical protein